jgi:hypothetical protein
MSYFRAQKRLKLARQREGEKYEAIKAASDRNGIKIEILESVLTAFIAENKSQIQAANRQAGPTDQSEREHQVNERSIRRSTKAIAGFTIVLGLVGIASAIISVLTLFSIQGQLTEMRDEQRPWVSFEFDKSKLVSGLDFDVNGAHFTVDFVVHNTGHLPARYVTIVPNVVLADHDRFGDDKARFIKRIASEKPSYAGSMTLFNGDERHFIPQININKDDLATSKRIKTILVNFTVCIVYFSFGEDKPKQTCPTFQLASVNGAIPLDKGSVALEQLRVSVAPFGPDYAN